MMPAGYMFGPRDGRRWYRKSGDHYVETCLCINRDGFEKKFDIEADAKVWRVPRSLPIAPLDKMGQGQYATQEIMLFERSPDRTPDGMAIFLEMV